MAAPGPGPAGVRGLGGRDRRGDSVVRGQRDRVRAAGRARGAAGAYPELLQPGFMGFVPAGSFVVAGLAAFAGTRWALAVPSVVILAWRRAHACCQLLSCRRATGAVPGAPAVMPGRQGRAHG